jgi:hypothetical protein
MPGIVIKGVTLTRYEFMKIQFSCNERETRRERREIKMEFIKGGRKSRD